MQPSKSYDCLIAGSGFAGAVAARRMADSGKKVLIIEKRSHTGGNAYDCIDHSGVLIHRYGPHIFHTKNKRVFDFLSRFTEWNDYRHRVKAFVNGKFIPVPFNLDSVEMCFDGNTAARLTQKLISIYGKNARVSISALKNSDDPDIQMLARFVYENVFLHYTMKQWGLTPDEIDPSVTSRVPVVVSHDDCYFGDPYQGMPADGYSALFDRMLDHKNIDVVLNTDVFERVKLENGRIYFDGESFCGTYIYTGTPDELYGYCFGELPYRTLDFKSETIATDYFQPCGTVNYTVSEDYTRITEFKYLTGQKISGVTSVMKEYSREYDRSRNDIPYYPIVGGSAETLYKKYAAKADETKGLYLLGRLAQYRYCNMDDIAGRALELCDTLLGE